MLYALTLIFLVYEYNFCKMSIWCLKYDKQYNSSLKYIFKIMRICFHHRQSDVQKLTVAKLFPLSILPLFFSHLHYRHAAWNMIYLEKWRQLGACAVYSPRGNTLECTHPSLLVVISSFILVCRMWKKTSEKHKSIMIKYQISFFFSPFFSLW